MKILVVEDHPADLKLVGAVLSMSGHIVGEHTSAEGVMDAIMADKPDIILMDLNLPGMDGLALARLLKAKAETRPIPLVAMTAYPDRFRREELIAAGCEICIVKPIDTRELPKQLEKAAGMKSQ
jgi:two-component system cell cycle response regulator